MTIMLKWTESPTDNHRTSQNIITASFHFAKLAGQSLLASPTALAEFQQTTGLADFYWEVSYYQEPNTESPLAQVLAEVDGFVIFLHGWCGSHLIWEDLPIRLIEQYPRLVCLNLDISGFAQALYLDTSNKTEYARIDNMMASIEYWLGAIGLWPSTYRQQKPFYLFVGHSMGGGMLFYKNQPNWQNEIYGCYLMSPSMYYHDLKRSLFYRLVATAILIPYTGLIKILSSHGVVWVAMNEASQLVKREHTQNFKNSSLRTLKNTLDGIGKSPPPPRTDWSQFKVVLGNRDVLVSPKHMLNFVEQLGFKPDQIRVTMGDHYFFSYDETSPITHKHNRQTVLTDLITFCRQLQK